MKALGIILLSLGLVVVFAGNSDAASRKRQKRTYTGPYVPPMTVTDAQRRRNQRGYERGDYYERDSNALPAGSKAWFEQKERENGCC